MQPGRSYAQDPKAVNFRSAKKFLEILRKARYKCHCMTCVGSPMGDHLSDHTPCDNAIEIACIEFAELKKKNVK